ncbi:MAG: hypothetical protein PUD34_05280 [bacterium]|nr:hypothetical protein [bacterium]
MTKFNREKALNQLEMKKKSKKYAKYLSIGIPCLVAVISVFYFAYAKFSTSDENDIVSKTVVGDFMKGDMVLAYTIDGTAGTGSFPSQNTGYEGTSVTCDNSATATWDNTTWSIKMTSMGTGSRIKCTVAFKTQETKKISGVTFKLNTFTPDFTKSACTTCDTKEAGVFAAADDTGTSYYYRGSVTNNYVSFAGKTWRIVRINGDGTVRIILNGTTGTNSQINASYSDNTYVGYMYGATGQTTQAATHANTNDSKLKQAIDTWYESNLKTSYASYLADSGFCGDRKPLATNTTAGTGTVTSYYNGYGRVVASRPSLKCLQTNDLYTTSSASTGNKALKYPIATITADEVLMAGSSGGVFDGGWNYTKGSTSYLNINTTYWTMTPAGGYVFYDGYGLWLALAFVVGAGGRFDDYHVTDTHGVRPVVNLVSGAIKSGTGTSSDPYVVS